MPKMKELSYSIDCYERDALFLVEVEKYEKAKVIIDKAYSDWCNPDENPELHDVCCEEYICSQLSENEICHAYVGSVSWEEEE